PCYICTHCLIMYVFDVQRVLHSFPTRRSSDLRFPTSPSARTVGRPSRSAATDRRTSGTCARPRAWPGRRTRSEPTSAATPRATRSEEHTSELQSRRDIVCRLLLEKKKHYKITE